LRMLTDPRTRCPFRPKEIVDASTASRPRGEPNWYVDGEKNGDVVVLAPTAECWKKTHPTN
jgi:hypothetical protein